jgi:hypothetical protein
MFCKKAVAAPCSNTILAATCSQNAPAPVNTASLLSPPSFTDVHLKQAAEAVAAGPGPIIAGQPEPVIVTNTPRAGETPEQIAARTAPREPLKVQVGGNHYKSMVIQPLLYSQVNELDFDEGSIVKYVSRWRSKNGIEDLKKARDFLDKKIAFEEAKAKAGLMGYLSDLFKSV